MEQNNNQRLRIINREILSFARDIIIAQGPGLPETPEAIERIKGKILTLRNEAAVIKARFNIGDLIIDPNGFTLRVDSIQAESYYSNEPVYKCTQMFPDGSEGAKRRATNSAGHVPIGEIEE